MSDGHAYRFESAAQLARGLRMNLSAHQRLAADSGVLVATLPAAPIWLNGADWLDLTGMLSGDCAGSVLGEVVRIVRSGRALWALADGNLLHIDRQSLQILDIAPTRARDIASDDVGGVWLLEDNSIRQQKRRGGATETLLVPSGINAHRIAAAGSTLFALDPARGELAVLRRNAPVLRLAIREIVGEPGVVFTANDIVADKGIVLLTGTWNGAPGWIGLDAKGDIITSGVWDRPPSFVTPAGEDLLAAFDSGGRWHVRRFVGAAAPAGELLLTPMLESDTLAGAWGRAQIMATLPEGATLDIAFAATADAALAASAQAIFSDDEQITAERVRKLRAVLPWSETLTYAAPQGEQAVQPGAFAAPLGEASGNLLWLAIAVYRNGAAASPAIDALVVQHDVPGLIDFLPAVFRTPEGDGDGTLRRLVAVLEATFLGFDDQIARLADRVDPDRTEPHWLASLAAMLGLPFDEVLSTQQRRALLRGAPAIIAGRGTRAGVLALLEAVLGDRPYRVIDRTAQTIPITLGDGRLPGFLAGPSARVPRLNARLVLGRTPLDPAGPCDGQVERAASLLVVIPARAGEQRRLGEALRQMIAALVPAGVRLELRWTGFERAAGGAVLGVAGEWPLIAPDAGLAPGAARLGGTNELTLRGDGIGLAQRLD